MSHFAEIEHTADRAFQAHGKDLRDLFQNAAAGLARFEGWPEISSGRISRELEIRGIDAEALLVNWLNELLYMHERYCEAYNDFEIVEISPDHLRAHIRGEPCNEVSRKIKAVTFHDIRVVTTKDGVHATIVVDV